MKTFLSRLRCLLGFALAATPTAYAGPLYTITDLGTIVAGYDSYYGQGINANGQVTGYGVNVSGQTVAFLYSGGTMINIGAGVG